MKLLEALAVLVAISAASAAFLDYHPLSEENIAIINQKAKTWTAGKNFEIDEWEKVKKIASGLLPRKSQPKKAYRSNPHDVNADVPETFDAREAWPNCDSIKQVRDQSGCGSCWAFGAVESMSDRICIHSNQTKQIYVSAEDITACCYGLFACGFGCDGGYIPESWEYWQDSGIVTGGLYQSGQGCQDYSLQPCEHHVNGTRPQCSTLNIDTPECTGTCYDTSLNYKESKTFGLEVTTFTNEKQIQLEILNNGPVEAGYTVYDDFVSYKSGVYQRTSDTPVGGHAIKILGWGVENDTKYWLIANSWNEDWGDKGFFKFLRGTNHCGMEEDVASSLPVL